MCVSNVHMTMETVDSPVFREVVNGADLVTSDGMPLVWMLRKLGLPDSERVYGPELVLRVCERAERHGIPIGLYGGTDESLDHFTHFLAERYPKLRVVYQWAPPFRPLTEEEDAAMVADLAESGAKILFVGIGCPKQERFMHAHKDSIQAVQLGVGAAFDFHSGSVPQAPGWMGRSGLEWFFRLFMEPKRLWRRYVIHNPRFMVRAAWQLLRHRSGTVFAPAAMILIALLFAAGFSMSSVDTEHSASPNQIDVLYVDQNHPQASDTNPGSAEFPFRTITAALETGQLGPGDVLIIGEGVYREALAPQTGGSGEHARLTIKAREGESVVITGADEYGQPESAGGTRWVLNNYQHLDFFGDDYVYQRELVIADDVMLRPVFDLNDLTRGTFFVERTTPTMGRIHMDTGSVSAPSLQVARRGALFYPGNPYEPCGAFGQPEAFHLVGLTFRHAANAAQFGAVCVGGNDSLLENVIVEETIGTGIRVVGHNHRLRNVSSNNNGQTGINGTCVGCSLVDTETSFNNFVGHDAFWEAGGGKWSNSAHLQFLRHTATGNEGPGLWLDGNNADVSVAYSLFDNNLAASVFIELESWSVTVERATISNTRRLGWTGAGILIQAAGGATLRSNHIFSNDGAGIWVRRDDRAEGGFNTFEGNLLQSNVRVPDQDRAGIQIDSRTHLELCSNLITDNTVEDSPAYFFSVDETGKSFSADSLDHFACLVDYSNR